MLITFFTAIGDYFLKKSSQQSGNFLNNYFVIGTVIYTMTAFLWVYVYRYMKFSTSVTIYSIFSILIFTAISFFVFKESLSIIEIFGIFFAIVSLFILARFG